MPDLIAEALIEAIVRGKFKGGVQLKQDEIAKQFDVSLIPVREALIQLEGKKLVSCIRNKGTIVRTLSIKEMRELLAVRKILEIGCVMIQPEQISCDVLDKMGYIIQKMDLAPDAFSFSRYNRLFYELFCDLSSNAQIKETYQNIFVRVERYLMYMYHLIPHGVMDTRSHERILELLRKGKKDQLIVLLPEIIETQEVAFLAFLEQQGPLDKLDFNNFLPF
ncbi:MAG: GntR family transcriptional regulator [Cellulosilyticaceae bacterium]